MLDPKGNTGIYLIFNYVRICSILRKGKVSIKIENKSFFLVWGWSRWTIDFGIRFQDYSTSWERTRNDHSPSTRIAWVSSFWTSDKSCHRFNSLNCHQVWWVLWSLQNIRKWRGKVSCPSFDCNQESYGNMLHIARNEDYWKDLKWNQQFNSLRVSYYIDQLRIIIPINKLIKYIY
jgi:hypothetical protein